MIGTAVIYRDKAGALSHALVVHVHEEEPLVTLRGEEREQVRSGLAARRALNLVRISSDPRALVGNGRGTIPVSDVPHAAHAVEGEHSWQELLS